MDTVNLPNYLFSYLLFIVVNMSWFTAIASLNGPCPCTGLPITLFNYGAQVSVFSGNYMTSSVAIKMALHILVIISLPSVFICRSLWVPTRTRVGSS